MPYIPEDEVERLKREADLAGLIRAAGVVLKRQGHNLVGLCPFHNDTTASLSVDPKKNLWHCFACEAGGSAIDWVMQTRHVGFQYAVEILREKNGGVTVSESGHDKRKPKLSSPLEMSADDQRLLEQVISYYHETLKKTPEALAYLAGRGIGKAELIEEFRIGFADRSLGLRVPWRRQGGKENLRSRLVKLGIFRQNGHEHFHGSVVFPIRDENGVILGAYGRKICPNLHKGTALHLYLPGPHKGFFNPRCLTSPEIILCEAIIDASSFWAYDFRNVTAAYGTSGFTEEMFQAFLGHGIRRVYTAYDPDPAGDSAAEQLAARLMAEGIECLRMVFPPGLDANAFVCADPTHAGENLTHLIQTARPMGNGNRVLFPSSFSTEESKGENPAQGEAAKTEGPVPSPSLAVSSAKEEKVDVGEAAASVAQASSPSLAAIEETAKEEKVGDRQNGAKIFCNRSVTVNQNGTSDEQFSSSSLATQEKTEEQESDNDRENGVKIFCNRSVTVNRNGTSDEQLSSPSLAALEETAKEEKGGAQKNAANEAQPSSPTVSQEEATKGRIAQGVSAQVKGEDIVIRLADRIYRIRGLDKNLSFDLLKINIRVNVGQRYHIDTLDLYHARQREVFIKAASEELGVNAEEIKSDLGRVLLKLEELQEEQIQRTLKSQKPQIVLNDAQRAQAMALLQDPRLMERIGEDFRRCGLVGEELNAQVGYICATSRKLDEPLALIIQAASAAGKTSLMDMILGFMPGEERVKYTAMTGQSLFYMDQEELVHKILAISEEEGMEQAKYAIKTMQSEKQLCIASTGKDPKSGKLTTHEYRVDGPAQIMLTSTAAEIDEELQNRCIVLTANEDREQTQAIQQEQRQRETLKGMLGRSEQEKLRRLHQNAQRLLRPIMVVNPFAPQLTFLDSRLRMRRDHAKYLTLIRAIALLHQYQRPEKKVIHQGQAIPYIEVDVKDIEIANRLANHVMGTSLDELAPQTRRLLNLLKQMVQEGCREKQVEQTKFHFTRKDVRDYTGWGNTQLKVHLDRLVDLEYLLTHYGRNGQRYVYELAYRGEGDKSPRFMIGLIDVEKLRGNGNSNYDPNLSG